MSAGPWKQTLFGTIEMSAKDQKSERQGNYSITSSARPSSESGTVMPSVLAVLRLMISSTFVDC